MKMLWCFSLARVNCVSQPVGRKTALSGSRSVYCVVKQTNNNLYFFSPDAILERRVWKLLTYLQWLCSSVRQNVLFHFTALLFHCFLEVKALDWHVLHIAVHKTQRLIKSVSRLFFFLRSTDLRLTLSWLNICCQIRWCQFIILTLFS